MSSGSRLSKLQTALRAQLEGAQFRQLNETLYTQSGTASFALLSHQPHLFHAYHKGYRNQVADWPQNPLDIMIAEVKKTPSAVVADMGCGEARLGATVPNKVHSFDLVAANESVVATDISKVPLTNEAVDIVVFCLSLMGTNFMDFLKEGMRVLRPGGRLLIAEVQSRFQQDAAAGEAAGAPGPTASARPGDKRRRDGGATASHSRSASAPSSEAAAGLASKKLPPGIASFADAVARLGCRLERHDTRNPMFALLFFRKLGSSAPGATPSEGSGGAASTTPALSVRERTGHEEGKRKKQRHAEAASSHMNVKKAGPASVSAVLPRKRMPGGTPPRAGAGGPTRKSEHGRSPRSAAAASDDTNRHDASTAATAPLLKACIYKRR